MNNNGAFDLLSSNPSIRASANEFLREYELPESQFHTFRRKFGELKLARDEFLKKKDLPTWEQMTFYSPEIEHSSKKIFLVNKTIFEADLSVEMRKHLSDLTLKGLRFRLAQLLRLINLIADREEVDARTISAYALQLISNYSKDVSTANLCKEIISEGAFADLSKKIPIDKSTFLLDLLEIGKKKYTSFRSICKSEQINFPSYSQLAECRNNAVLVNELEYIRNVQNFTIGIALSYRRILFQTLSRLFLTLSPFTHSEFALFVKIADGLDGFGSHQIYSQYELNPAPSRKNYILSAFKMLSFENSTNSIVWRNNNPNSSFGVRPVLLMAQKECIENVKYIMSNYITVHSRLPGHLGDLAKVSQ